MNAKTLFLGEKDEETFLAKVAEGLKRPLTADERWKSITYRNMGFSASYLWWLLSGDSVPKDDDSPWDRLSKLLKEVGFTVDALETKYAEAKNSLEFAAGDIAMRDFQIANHALEDDIIKAAVKVMNHAAPTKAIDHVYLVNEDAIVELFHALKRAGHIGESK